MSSVQTLEVPGFQVVQFLGSGAKSSIWQIKDRNNGDIFALKRVVKRGNEDNRFIQQAINEYTIGSTLNHPNVRKIFKLQRITRWLSLREVHLFMEWCPGKSVQEDRPGDIRQCARIFLATAEAMAYINSRGFVHADLKPNNIIVSPEGGVKVIDLGQSCAIGTVKERIQGTPDFIAPEQVHLRPLDAKTDCFNFGATFYWALTGKPIPTVLPKHHVSNLKADVVVPPPEKYNPHVPSSLSKLVTDCIEMNPVHRPESMAEVASRLGLVFHTLNQDDRKADPG